MSVKAVAAVLLALLATGASLAPDAVGAVAPPSRERGATLAGIAVAVEARSRPGGGSGLWRAGPATSWSGEPQVLLVLGSTERDGRQWLRVLLPIRPNHSAGWIPRDNVVLLHTAYWIRVARRVRRVEVYRGGRRIRSFRAVIGKPARPTPDGLAAIYERDAQPNPAGFLGSWALPLTIFSEVLEDFGGGRGRIAIHGRAGASLRDPLGSARSHGCIRIEDSAVEWMAAHIPQGAPVEIT